MTISDGLRQTMFCWKMEKMRALRKKMDGKVVILCQSRKKNTSIFW